MAPSRTVHGFPAKMAPSIVADALTGLPKDTVVLDPMCGSGTAIVEAVEKGLTAVGFDLDPLASLIAKVSVTPIDGDELERRGRQVLTRAESIVADAALETVSRDARTEDFVRFWFDDQSASQLRALATCIRRVRAEELRRALWVSFSNMIIVKENGVSRAADVAHSRPHRVYESAPAMPFDLFGKAVHRVAGATRTPTPTATRATVARADARRLPILSDSVDVVVTSPPYLNAIDYIRASRFSLVWMGYDFTSTTSLRSSLIGTEVGLPQGCTPQWVEAVMADADVSAELPARHLSVIRRYVLDLGSFLAEMQRVLRTDGKLIAVIGDSLLRSAVVSNSQMLALAADHIGLRLETSEIRSIPAKHRYLPPPSPDHGAELGKRMKDEAVLTFVA